MGDFFKSVARVAAPVIGTAVAPGIGTALGSGLSSGTLATIGGAAGGALGTAATGGGLKDTLISGALGGVSGAAPGIAGATGATGAANAGLTGALRGASLGGIGGGTEGALTGALLGGAGSYLGSGGNVPGLGNLGTGGSISSGGAPFPGVKPTGALGGIQRALPTASSAGGAPSGLLGGNGGMLGDVFRAGTAGYAQQQAEQANEEIRRRLLEAQGRAEQAYQPLYDTGAQANQQLTNLMQDPSAIQDSPAYDFRMQQGEQALQNQLAASGMSQSGAAMRRALELGQQMASQEYGNQFNRLQSVGRQGQAAAGDLANLYRDTGGIEAVTRAANQQGRDRMLSQILGNFLPQVNNYGFM